MSSFLKIYKLIRRRQQAKFSTLFSTQQFHFLVLMGKEMKTALWLKRSSQTWERAKQAEKMSPELGPRNQSQEAWQNTGRPDLHNVCHSLYSRLASARKHWERAVQYCYWVVTAITLRVRSERTWGQHRPPGWNELMLLQSVLRLGREQCSNRYAARLLGTLGTIQRAAMNSWAGWASSCAPRQAPRSLQSWDRWRARRRIRAPGCGGFSPSVKGHGGGAARSIYINPKSGTCVCSCGWKQT